MLTLAVRLPQILKNLLLIKEAGNCLIQRGGQVRKAMWREFFTVFGREAEPQNATVSSKYSGKVEKLSACLLSPSLELSWMRLCHVLLNATSCLTKQWQQGDWTLLAWEMTYWLQMVKYLWGKTDFRWLLQSRKQDYRKNSLLLCNAAPYFLWAAGSPYKAPVFSMFSYCWLPLKVGISKVFLEGDNPRCKNI